MTFRELQIRGTGFLGDEGLYAEPFACGGVCSLLGNLTLSAALVMDVGSQNGPGAKPRPFRHWDGGGRQWELIYGKKPRHALSNLKANVCKYSL